MKSAPVTWLYCLLRSPKRPSLGKVPPGPPQTERARLLDAGDSLWLLVSGAAQKSFGEGALNARLGDLEWVSQCALGHEAVVAHARKKAAAVAPMKLFTLFRSDERAQAFAAAERGWLERVLDRVEGCAEYGVRLALDEGRARAQAQKEASLEGPARGGAAFLQHKRRLQQVAAQVGDDARSAAVILYRSLAEVAQEARRRTEVEGMAPGARLLLDGVFLVKEPGGARFEARLRAAEKELAPRGYLLSSSGPWPPYHFVVEAP